MADQILGDAPSLRESPDPVPTRPALRWHGGKWILAPWIIENLPAHRVYVEPFGGAASVLIRKPRSYAEVYNDLDGDVVNYFRVMRDPLSAVALANALQMTPFARAEFIGAYEPTDEPVERARRMVVRSFMGFGSDAPNITKPTGFRANSNRSGTTPAHDWTNYPRGMAALAARLAGVVVEHRDAAAVMAAHDGPDTLHYVDPPHVTETRSRQRGKYRHEMTDADHGRLLEALRGLSGKVVLSGYPHPLYEAALHDWRRIERAALADGARARTEVLWMNHEPDHPTLFSEGSQGRLVTSNSDDQKPPLLSKGAET